MEPPKREKNERIIVACDDAVSLEETEFPRIPLNELKYRP